jgi:hypothetical protein
MATSTQPRAHFGAPLQWLDFDGTPILFANHFLVQHQPNEFVLTFGQVTGPPVVGTPEEIREQTLQIGSVPIRTLARTGLTRDRMVELIGILQETLREHDRVAGAPS